MSSENIFNIFKNNINSDVVKLNDTQSYDLLIKNLKNHLEVQKQDIDKKSSENIITTDLHLKKSNTVTYDLDPIYIKSVNNSCNTKDEVNNNDLKLNSQIKTENDEKIEENKNKKNEENNNNQNISNEIIYKNMWEKYLSTLDYFERKTTNQLLQYDNSEIKVTDLDLDNIFSTKNEEIETFTSFELKNYYLLKKQEIINDHFKLMKEYKMTLKEKLETIKEKRFFLKKLKKQYKNYIHFFRKKKEESIKSSEDSSQGENTDLIEKNNCLKDHTQMEEIMMNETIQQCLNLQSKTNKIYDKLRIDIKKQNNNITFEIVLKEIENEIYSEIYKLLIQIIKQYDLDLNDEYEIREIVIDVVMNIIGDHVYVIINEIDENKIEKDVFLKIPKKVQERIFIYKQYNCFERDE